MIFPKTTRRQKSYWIVKSTSIERIIYSSKKVFQLHVKRTYTFWVSHFLHCCWRNHDRHWNLEAQDSCWHVNLANINKNAWPKSIFRGKSGEMREEQTINLKSRKIYRYRTKCERDPDRLICNCEDMAYKMREKAFRFSLSVHWSSAPDA